MSRSSSETQSLRRSAQPTRPCAEAHALPHAQRSSVSYALSPPRSHGTAPRPTGPLRRVPSLNLVRPRSGSSRRSHAQRSAMASDPPDATPRARRRPSRTAFGGVACRARHGCEAAVCSLAPRALSPPRLNRTRLRGPCGSAVADTITGPRRPMLPPSRLAACARQAPCIVRSEHRVRCRCAIWCHVWHTGCRSGRCLARSYRSTPCVYAAIAHAQNPCVSYRRVQSFFC